MTTTINIFLLFHGFPRQLLLFLFIVPPFAVAQLPMGRSSSSSPPPPPPDPFNMGPKFNPSMAIIMVVLIGAFFLLGFFSIYIRQCAERRRYAGGNLDPAIAAAMAGVGNSRRQGLADDVIQKFPVFAYSAVKGLKIGKGSLECAVCLSEFEDDQTLRLIPKCSHVFHPDCIDAWLAYHTTCPVCRANLVPKPGEPDVSLVQLLETDNHAIESDHRHTNNEDTEDQISVHVEEPPRGQGLEVSFLNPAVQNRPPRSWSTGWRLSAMFPRSHSTGHSLVQRGENLERFTLRLPEDVRNQLFNTQLSRAKSCVAFPRAPSTRKGYRSKSGGSGRGKGYFQYERFDRGGQSDRWGFIKVPSFLSRNGSVRSSKGVNGGDGGDEGSATTPKNLLRPVKSPFDCLFIGEDNNNNGGDNSNVGERSFDRLKPDSQV